MVHHVPFAPPCLRGAFVLRHSRGMSSPPKRGALDLRGSAPPGVGTRQGMYVAFIKNAMLQKSQVGSVCERLH